MRFPSVKTLARAFPHPLRDNPTLCQFIRNAMRDLKPDDAMGAINKALEGHGVEAIPFDDEADCFRCGSLSTYINMGDAYGTTIVWDAHKRRFIVTSWGDFVEWSEKQGRMV